MKQTYNLVQEFGIQPRRPEPPSIVSCQSYPKPTIIVDLDGCVCKTDFILKEAEQLGLKGKEYWEYFHENVHRRELIPWCVDLVNKYAKTHYIIFLTARSSEIYVQTTEMLRTLFPTAKCSIGMREIDDKRKACKVKEGLLKIILVGDVYRIDFAIDDEGANCDVFKKYGIPTLQVK